MSTDALRKLEVHQWKVLALNMRNDDLVTSLSAHKHREIMMPLECDYTDNIR
jgi:hypothetical protein